MEHQRITVEEVLAAYESTGVRKTKAAYYWCDHDVDEGVPPIDCGCPAFAVALARERLTVAELRERQAGQVDSFRFTCDRFHPTYLGAFTYAVDTGHVVHESWSPLSVEGCHDGLAVRAALWPELEATNR